MMLQDKRSFEQLLRETGAPLILLDAHGVIRELNEGAVGLLGGRREDYLGKDVVTLIDPVDRYFVENRRAAADRDRLDTVLITVRLRKGMGSGGWHSFRFERGSVSVSETGQIVRIERVQIPKANA